MSKSNEAPNFFDNVAKRQTLPSRSWVHNLSYRIALKFVTGLLFGLGLLAEHWFEIICWVGLILAMRGLANG